MWNNFNKNVKTQLNSKNLRFFAHKIIVSNEIEFLEIFIEIILHLSILFEINFPKIEWNLTLEMHFSQ